MSVVAKRIFENRSTLSIMTMMRMLVAHWLMKAASKVHWDMFEAIAFAVGQNAMARMVEDAPPCGDPECEACAAAHGTVH